MNSYGRYHALCWAEGKSRQEIEAEIATLEASRHTYQWNEVGCAEIRYARIDTLKEVLAREEGA